MNLRSMATWISIAGATVLAPVGARAESRDPAAADVLFQQGREAMKKGDLVVACGKFAESQRLDPAPGTLLNLADCEEKSGKLASALSHLRDAVDALATSDERLPLARSRIAALDKRVPRLTVKLARGAPSDTRVRRGDVELRDASIGTPLPVDPGSIVIVASAPGRQARTIEVSIAAGQMKTVSAEPGDPAPVSADIGSAEHAPAPESSQRIVPPVDAPSADQPDGKVRRIAGWTLLGVGTAGIGLGVISLVTRQSDLDAAARRCPSDNCVSPGDPATTSANASAFHTDLDNATHWKNVAVIGLAGGVLASAGGVLLLMTAPSATPSSVRSGPTFAAGMPAGVAVEGTW